MFQATGIEVTLPSDTSSSLYAQATASNVSSACSATPLVYVTTPSAPVLTGTTPASPANDNHPRVKGTANAGTTVNLFTAPTCTGATAGTGSAADLAGTGIQVSVPDDSATTFYAQATSANGASPCSAGVSYTEVTPKPDPVVLPAGPPHKKPKCKKRVKKGSAAAAKKQCKGKGRK